MLEKFVEDSRYNRTKTLLTEVFASPSSMPKVIVAIAAAGVGKTTLLRYFCVQLRWVYFPLKEYQSVAWLVAALAGEVCNYSYRSIQENYDAIVGALREKPRGIVCDEAHRVARHLDRYEVLRDISDEASVPLVLSGTEDLSRAIHALGPLESRIAGWITIAPCNFADAKLYAEQLCEIVLADDLIKTVHEITAGSARGIVIALSRLESLARRRGAKRLRLADIPERFSFTYQTRNRRHAIATDTDAAAATANEPAKPTLKMVV